MVVVVVKVGRTKEKEARGEVRGEEMEVGQRGKGKGPLPRASGSPRV
jgi:hypothetical protein